MFLTIIHTGLRLVVLALGIGLAYATVFLLFPWFNEKLPLMLALFVLYCLLAYGAIPLLLRLRHFLLRPDHVPLYAITPDGWPSDPVNIALVVKNKRELIHVMKKAGWYKADKVTLKTVFRALWAIIFSRPYPNAPFSSLYLFGRPFDIGFQLPKGKNLSPASRHHVRFWRLSTPKKQKHFSDYHFWLEQLEELFGYDETPSHVWIGAAIDDINPFGIQWRDGRLTHRTDMDTDKERDFLVKTLQEQNIVEKVTLLKAGEPFSFRGQQFHHKFVCDGNVKVVNIENFA